MSDPPLFARWCWRIVAPAFAALPVPALADECAHAFAPLGSGTAGGLTLPAVLSAVPFDPDGDGKAPRRLYVGGNFTHAGELLVNSVATWNGTSWGRLVSPGGLVGVGGGQVVTAVSAMTVYDDDADGPRQPALYVAGDFTTAGDIAARHIARWDGSTWSALGAGVDWGDFAANARVLAVFDEDGSGPFPPALFVGGDFVRAGNMPARFIARWDGTTWSDVGGGVDATVSGLAVYDDGSGPALYAAGNFTTAGSMSLAGERAVDTQFIARWDGAQWSAVGGGVNGSVRALAVYTAHDIEELYAGGYFTQAGTIAANLAARWNGSDWSPLGSGLDSSLLFPGIEAMAVYDDGTGADLYVTGQFETAGGGAATNLASWNGFHWSAVDGGVGAGDLIASGRSFGVYRGDLYVGGNFSQAGETFANNIARWNRCPPSCPADLFPIDAPDGFVGRADVAVLRARWGDCPSPCDADLFPLGAPDGVVNVHDLAELLGQQGRCP